MEETEWKKKGRRFDGTHIVELRSSPNVFVIRLMETLLWYSKCMMKRIADLTSKSNAKKNRMQIEEGEINYAHKLFI